MSKSKSVITWFEIPCADLDRAARFYEAMTGTKLRRMEFVGVPHAMLASSEDVDVGGALVADPNNAPSGKGTVVYLDARGELDAWLERAQRAGGTIALPKTSIGEIGEIAFVIDTEGNRVGLHTR
ncbi:VOC family protein [Sandaracinus amylolyticus]|uniref:Glyoxalase family protein n=1 Tax=Sandaracinus amylolyticus TaxID=927083 RepID=A0A0F6YPR9_9BACT|nr:VOC family protein [Sandaracinus amylolyticus]AKF11753.1 Glyoxalase family protein [Sandaracinus amylolyticus]